LVVTTGAGQDVIAVQLFPALAAVTAQLAVGTLV
jgi:hypothetical protein